MYEILWVNDRKLGFKHVHIYPIEHLLSMHLIAAVEHVCFPADQALHFFGTSTIFSVLKYGCQPHRKRRFGISCYWLIGRLSLVIVTGLLADCHLWLLLAYWQTVTCDCYWLIGRLSLVIVTGLLADCHLWLLLAYWQTVTCDCKAVHSVHFGSIFLLLYQQMHCSNTFHLGLELH